MNILVHRSFFLIYAISLFLACQRTEKLQYVESTDEFGFTSKYYQQPETGAMEGWLHKFDKENRLVESAHYLHDTLHGNRILFYDNGDTMTLETYQSGQFEGPFRAWHENGKLEIDGRYSNNAMEGIWRAYYNNGQLKETVTFANNAENGPFVEYFPNGQLKAEGTYRDGDNEHGLLKVYDETGALLRTMMCQMGVCRTIQPDTLR